MHKLKYLLPLVLTILFLAGCIDTDDTFTINPDGSGKVIHKALIPSDSMQFNLGEELSEEEKFQNAVKDELTKAKGVDAWKDVTFAKEGESIRFEGTAYFKNINKLKFHNSGVTVGMYNDLKFSEDSGYMTIEIMSDKSKKDEKEVAVDTPLTEEEVLAKIEEQRAEYAKSRLMLAGLMQAVHRKRRFYLPGTSVEVSNFQKESDGSFLNDFQGSKMIEIMDAKINDDDYMRKEIEEGRNVMKDGPGGDDQMNELIFTNRGPVRIEVEHRNQILFDYEAEVALAREQFADTQNKLGIIPEAPAQASDAGSFQVGGIRIVKYSDNENMVRAFNYDKGYTVSIYGRLPEKAMSVTEGRLTALLTDTGEDILPEGDWDQKISFPGLSNDGMVTIFEVQLKNIPQDAQLIKELSGTIDYLVGGATKEIDLGIGQFAAGTAGTQFNARISEIKPDDWDKSKQALVLKIDKSKDEIKKVIFYDSSGQLLEVESRGSMYSGNNVTYTFSRKDGDFPAQGSIAIEAYDDLQRKKISFTLNDLEIFRIK